MKFRNFRIKNFKCFDDTGLVPLSNFMNIVSGQNNAGKTAMLQSLSLSFSDAAHRSAISMPKRGSTVSRPSELEFTASISQSEFAKMAAAVPNINLPMPDIGRLPAGLKARLNANQPFSEPNQKAVWTWISEHSELEFKLLRSGNGAFSPQLLPSHQLYANTVAPVGQAVPHVLISTQGEPTFRIQQLSPTQDMGAQIAPALAGFVYRFTAERFARGVSAAGTNTILDPSALNLPEVLHVLQSSNPDSYADFISIVREVLPQLKWVSVVPISGNQLRIEVWSIDKAKKRDDLTVSLSESGTGIGQVLAIVYVAYSNEDERVILIDEPQSFLHPSAARKLIDVLKRFPQHQYIIGTHSPGVIAASEAGEILILDNKDGATTVGCMSTTDSASVRVFLGMLGTRLSDIFGMDQVIWVEGPTEEISLPFLLRKMNEHKASTSVISIRNTGDLVGKDREKFFEIYNNVSIKTSVIPRETAFIFDAEDRSQTDKDEIIRRSRNRAYFLPRRTFENYLLNEKAIHAVINEIPNFSETGETTQAHVTNFLETNCMKPEFWKPLTVPHDAGLTSPGIHGARILEALFSELSNHRVTYEKTEHSVKLFQWILENDFGKLTELKEFMKKVLAFTA
jgi:hypothetical protein